jgi:hypothetical protein
MTRSVVLDKTDAGPTRMTGRHGRGCRRFSVGSSSRHRGPRFEARLVQSIVEVQIEPRPLETLLRYRIGRPVSRIGDRREEPHEHLPGDARRRKADGTSRVIFTITMDCRDNMRRTSSSGWRAVSRARVWIGL